MKDWKSQQNKPSIIHRFPISIDKLISIDIDWYRYSSISSIKYGRKFPATIFSQWLLLNFINNHPRFDKRIVVWQYTHHYEDPGGGEVDQYIGSLIIVFCGIYR
jgi:hypothetical protein